MSTFSAHRAFRLIASSDSFIGGHVDCSCSSSARFFDKPEARLASGEQTVTVLPTIRLISAGTPRQVPEQTGIPSRSKRLATVATSPTNFVLTKDAPLGDAVFGPINTVSTRHCRSCHRDASITSPNPADNFAGEPDWSPIDRGDVCVNYDKTWFKDHQLTLPQAFEDWQSPEYKNMLVAMNPASSTPEWHLNALATITKYGPDVTRTTEVPQGQRREDHRRWSQAFNLGTTG